MPTSLTVSSSPQYTNSGTKVIGPIIISGFNNCIAIQDIAIPLISSGYSYSQVEVVAPYGATGAVVVPPPSNASPLILQGVQTDTGIPIQPNMPFIITFANPNSYSSFWIKATQNVSGVIEVSFF